MKEVVLNVRKVSNWLSELPADYAITMETVDGKPALMATDEGGHHYYLFVPPSISQAPRGKDAVIQHSRLAAGHLRDADQAASERDRPDTLESLLRAQRHILAAIRRCLDRE